MLQRCNAINIKMQKKKEIRENILFGVFYKSIGKNSVRRLEIVKKVHTAVFMKKNQVFISYHKSP